MTINESEFPNLAKETYERRSEPDAVYNCIAWAGGRNDEIWDPDEDAFWPIETREYTMMALIAVFEKLGFVQCGLDTAHELGFQKVALFGIGEGYEHAARQLRNGRWTSKMGLEDDIDHPNLDALAGGSFGDVMCVLRRPYPKDALGDAN